MNQDFINAVAEVCRKYGYIPSETREEWVSDDTGEEDLEYGYEFFSANDCISAEELAREIEYALKREAPKSEPTAADERKNQIAAAELEVEQAKAELGSWTEQALSFLLKNLPVPPEVMLRFPRLADDVNAALKKLQSLHNKNVPNS